MTDLIDSAEERARNAHRIADVLKDSGRLHVLATETALVLDEVVLILQTEAFRQDGGGSAIWIVGAASGAP